MRERIHIETSIFGYKIGLKIIVKNKDILLI